MIDDLGDSECGCVAEEEEFVRVQDVPSHLVPCVAGVPSSLDAADLIVTCAISSHVCGDLSTSCLYNTRLKPKSLDIPSWLPHDPV